MALCGLALVGGLIDAGSDQFGRSISYSGGPLCSHLARRVHSTELAAPSERSYLKLRRMPSSEPVKLAVQRLRRVDDVQLVLCDT